jgi:hypothetical protein
LIYSLRVINKNVVRIIDGLFALKREEEIPDDIWVWMWDELSQVSDEIGIDINGRYLLTYEGWSGFCVEPTFNPERSDGDNEDAYFEYAEDESGKVIGEWLKELRGKYKFIIAGHERMNLYGVTWALFRLKRGYTHNVTEH